MQAQNRIRRGGEGLLHKSIMSEYTTTPRDNRFIRLLKRMESSQVQGLFMMMFVKGKSMNDVERETGISRQTISKWRKGGNIMHVNVQKISEIYDLDPIELYDADMYLVSEIGRAGRSVESTELKQLYSDFKYYQSSIDSVTQPQSLS